MKGAYDSHAIGIIISHLMFNNLDFTKKSLYLVCEVFNESLTINDIKHNIEVFQTILEIKDRYSRHRLEWIIGIPQLNLKYTSGSMPSYPKFYNKQQFDKPISFISPLLSASNHDTLLVQLFRMNTNSDLPALLYFFFKLMFSNREIFNYVDSLPSPIQEDRP